MDGLRNWPFAAPDRANYRMLGVADLARALTTGAAPRASGDLALHVLEVMEAMLTAAASCSCVEIEVGCERPPALSEADAAALMA